MSTKNILSASITAIVLASPALSATISLIDQEELSFGFDFDQQDPVSITPYSLGEALFEGILPNYTPIIKWGEEFLTPAIEGSVSSYQERFSDELSPRVVTRYSENNGTFQECRLDALPDNVYHLNQTDLEGLSQSDIIDGVLDGALLVTTLPMREQDPNGVLSNAQYLRSNDSVLIVQAGHNALQGFAGVIVENQLRVIDGTIATAEQKGSAYMSAFEGIMDNAISGNQIVTVQNGHVTATISVYDETVDLSSSFNDCKTSLQDNDVRQKMVSNESITSSFNASVVGDQAEGYDRLYDIITEQARKDTATAIDNGADIQLIRLERATGIVAGYPYGAQYRGSDGINQSFGCYIKETRGENGELLSFGVSNSFLDASNTSCMGGLDAVPGQYEETSDAGMSYIHSPASNNSGNGGDGDSDSDDDYSADSSISTIFTRITTTDDTTTITHETDTTMPAVPLPATLALLLGSLGSFAVFKRRRKP